MKREFQIMLLVTIAVLAFLPITSPEGIVQESSFTPQPLEDIIASAAVVLASLIGIPVFLAGILAILEYYGKISPAGSDQVQMIANTVLYAACFLAVLFGKTHLLSALDHYLGGIAPILVALLAFLSGGVYSIVKTRSFINHIRSLYPVRLNSKAAVLEKEVPKATKRTRQK